jgi:hypothetical protein
MKQVLERQVPLAEVAAAAEEEEEEEGVQQLPALLQIEVPWKRVDDWRLAAEGEVGEEPRVRARARTRGLH